MYTYLPYAVVTREQALFLWAELHRRMFEGEVDFMKDDLTIPGGHGPGGGNVFYRVRDGVPKYFLTETDDPSKGHVSEAQIPILYDSVAADDGSVFMNHIWPLGGNVLYMDGHVEYRRFPNSEVDVPYSLDVTDWSRENVYDNASLRGVPPWCSNRPVGMPFEPRYRYYPRDPRYLGLVF